MEYLAGKITMIWVMQKTQIEYITIKGISADEALEA
jgi:hypothetical protein